MINKFMTLAFSFILIFISPLFSAEVHEAVQEGNIERIQELVEADRTNLELKNDRQFTPLNLAVTEGNLEIFMYLLEIGADINTVDIDGSNLLINATGGGNLEIVKFLVEEKAFDVNFVDNNGFTSFHSGAGSGNVELLKYLIEKGANIHTTTNIGSTPIVSAIYSGNLEIVKYFMEIGCEYDIPNQFGVSPIHYAAYLGNIEVVKLLQNEGVNLHKVTQNARTPFIWSVIGRRFEVADYLLENGADVNERTSRGSTALHNANRLRIESIDYLINKGAEITAVDSNGNTALHMAGYSGKDEVVTKLIECGLEINAINNNGKTAFNNACSQDSIDVLEVLLKNGATLSSKKCDTKDGCSSNTEPPLYDCVNQGKMNFVNLLFEYNADPNEVEHNFGRTALHIAAIRGENKLINLLIQKGAKVNTKDSFGNTPLYYSKIYQNAETENILMANDGKSGKIDKKYSSSLLQESVKKSQSQIWFTGHAGWIFKTANNLLIVDYWERGNKPQNPCLSNGWIDPEEIKDLNVTVLVSHDHLDHYDPVIWEWRESIPNIRYILGMKVPVQEDYIVIQPRTALEYDNLEITAFESNDSGVGFVIEADGVTIFHPGDHANETRDFSGTYWPEIEYVKDNFPNIDIAMMPIRGCSLPDVESVRLGVIRTLQELEPKIFLPMHSSDDGYQYRNFNKNLLEEDIKDTKLYYPLDKGDRFIYRKGKLK